MVPKEAEAEYSVQASLSLTAPTQLLTSGEGRAHGGLQFLYDGQQGGWH